MGRKEKIQPTEQPFWPSPPMSSTCPQKNRIGKHHFQASPSPKVGLSSRLPPRSCFCFFSYNPPSLRIYQTLCVVLIRRKTMMEMKTWPTPRQETRGVPSDSALTPQARWTAGKQWSSVDWLGSYWRFSKTVLICRDPLPRPSTWFCINDFELFFSKRSPKFYKLLAL